MGYFDGLASGSIKKDAEGRTVFYPLGVLGRGRVLPNEAAEQRVREFLIRYYKVSLPVIIGLGALVNWLWSAALVPVFMAWFYFGTKSLVAGYPYSDSKLTLKEGYANSAAAHNAFTLWALLICSVLFVVGGILMASTAHATEQRLIGVGSVAFFGLTSVALGYMLWARRA